MHSFLEKTANMLWGSPLITMLLILGLILSLKSRFYQLRKLPLVLKSTVLAAFSKDRAGKSGFNEMCLALGGTIGVGNIAGVSAAIVSGGPGAVFWMIISGFFGMVIKYTEVALAVKFRSYSPDGESIGGPMYYIKNSGTKIIKPFGIIFSVVCLISSFFMGNMAQSGTVAVSFHNAFGFNKTAVCFILSVVLLIAIVGKAEKLKKFASIFVPIMSIFYISVCIISIIYNIENLWASIKLILSDAFNFNSISGGVGAYGVSKAISVGFSRGLFTNEAGLGSSPIAHASAKNATPHTQGLWGMAEVFIDTIVVCSITSLAVLCSDTYLRGTRLSGIELTSAAISEAVGEIIGKGAISVSVAFFAFASIIAWNYYGRCSLNFISTKKIYSNIYSVLFVSFSFLGAFFNVDDLLLIGDIFNAPLIFINIPVLAILYPTVINNLSKRKE